MQHYIYLALFFPSKNSINQSARSMWAARASWGVLFEEVADFEVEVWEVGSEAEPEILEQKAHCALD